MKNKTNTLMNYKSIYYKITIGLILLSGAQLYAQSPLDSVNIEATEIEQIQPVFEDNLDSTLNLWYIQNSGPSNEILEEPDTATVPGMISIPDSVYSARLAKLPFSFKMTYNPIVRKYIEMYTQKKRDKIEIMLGMADYYFPKFDDVFDYYDVPNEIKYMSIIESALNPRARSRTRAIGVWQFMYGTGKRYGLTINSLVDERRDPVKETHAAAKFSKDLFNIFGDWQLVVAAYNCGPGNVNKAIRRARGKRDFWEIYRYLPRETRGHVPAFIAAAYLMNYYKEHGLTPSQSSFPGSSDTIMIQENLHLAQVSAVLKIPMEQLRDLNPQYIHDIIPARGTSHPLMLPGDQVGRFIDLQDSIFAFRDSLYFNPSDLNKKPELVNHRGMVYAKRKGNLSLTYYIVKSGDNLGLIAEQFNCRVNDIMDWNNMYNHRIRQGQKLAIYIPGKALQKSAKNNQTEVKESSKTETSKSKDVVNKDNKSNKVQTIYYTVKEGDTLWGIAKQYPGISGEDIRRWNNISRNASIIPGQQIVIKVM